MRVRRARIAHATGLTTGCETSPWVRRCHGSRSFEGEPGVAVRQVHHEQMNLCAILQITATAGRRTRAFSALTSHDLFAARFGRPGKGDDKGKVENLVGMPGATTWCRCRGRRPSRR